MKNRALEILLGLVAVAPLVVTIACGGKIAPDSVGGAAPAATSGFTPVLSTAWPACPGDSAPLPLPSSPDPEIAAMCTQFCNRTFDCERCSLATCLPNCLADGLERGPCGGTYVTWMKCVLDHTSENACGAVPACDAAYCEYAQCGAGPGAPVPHQCH